MKICVQTYIIDSLRHSGTYIHTPIERVAHYYMTMLKEYHSTHSTVIRQQVTISIMPCFLEYHIL